MSKVASVNLKPFIKWVGGKTQFLEIIDLLSPTSFNRLIEPFVGGGAVFLNKRSKQTIINDTNQELITTYQIIKNQPQELLKLLREYERNHTPDFYEVLRKQKPSELTQLGAAARFIYLNKTGFNGLYRVNSKGEFNVPFGKKEKIKLFNKENILTISEYLNSSNCQIFNQDYQTLLSQIQTGDFLFVDPPYDNDRPNGFTEYTSNGFNQKNQQELFQFLKQAEKQGAKWLLTNHATNFIKELYRNYQQFTKKAYRYINCQGDKRVGSAQEIFIWNYELNEEQKRQLEFEKYFDTIQSTNISLEKLVDWKKVNHNFSSYKKDLESLNFLLGNSEGLMDRIEKLWKETPHVFQIIPFLLAVKDDNFSWLANKKIKFWEEENLRLEKVKEFIISSSLVDLFTSSQIKDLKDYAQGIEVGLDTHTRKNRGGELMEEMVKNLLTKYRIEYQEQKPHSLNGKKRVDFWWKIKDQEYYCEVNFFNTTGSKISEIIRSYTHLYQLAQKQGINFLWIGDGKGLKGAKIALKEAFFTTKNLLFTIAKFEEWLKTMTEG